MYNIIIYIYLLGVAIASRWDGKIRKMWRGERDAFDVLREKVDPNARYLWFHAASLGEFEQGRPLMERLREIRPEYKILLNELKKFNPELLDKDRILAISKSDMLDEELIKEIKPHLPRKVPYIFISSVTGENIPQLKDMLWKALNKPEERRIILPSQSE